MNRRVFMVALDANHPTSDLERFQAGVRESPAVLSWWNHLPFVYLVSSDRSADGIGADLVRRTGIRSFLVMQVIPSESEGLLPDDAWQWITRQSRELGLEPATDRVSAAAE